MVRLISMRWVEMSLPLQIFHKHLLFQIKVCYSKNFTRVNCDGIKSNKGGRHDGKVSQVGYLLNRNLSDKNYFQI